LLYKLDPSQTESLPKPEVTPPKAEVVTTDNLPYVELSEHQEMSGAEDGEEGFDDEDEYDEEVPDDMVNEAGLENLVAILQGIQQEGDGVIEVVAEQPSNSTEPAPAQQPTEPTTSQTSPPQPSSENNQTVPPGASPPVPQEQPAHPAIPPAVGPPGAQPQTFRINFSQLLRILPFPEQELQTLMSLGFPEWRCRKALLLNFFDPEMALEWLLNHSNDPNVDDPLSEEEAAQIIGAIQNLRNVAEENTSNIEEQIEQCIKNHKCTFTVTKKEFAPQRWYYCYSCGLVDSEGVCESCAAVCHKNHKLSAVRSSSKFYCDCGAGAYNCKCNTE